jgi:hypothetical protein
MSNLVDASYDLIIIEVIVEGEDAAIMPKICKKIGQLPEILIYNNAVLRIF